MAIERAVSEVADVLERYGHALREVGDSAATEPAMQAQWERILGRVIDAAAVAIERNRSAGVALNGLPDRALAAALMWIGARNLVLMTMRSANALPVDEIVETVITAWLRTVFGLHHQATSANP